MGIQIYDQVSIIRSTSKVNLHRTVLLGFGLKELKVTLNIAKVGMRTYHPNAHQKIWSNFNSEKFVKSETLLCGFAKVGVKGGENSSERHKSWSACLFIKWASKSMIKFQLREKSWKVKLCRAFSLEFGLKRVQKARNIAKFGMFTMLRAILGIFKPNPSKTTQRSFTFEQFLTIEIWS